MKNPFREGGPLDFGSWVIGLVSAVGLVVNEIRMRPHGASWWWVAAAGILLALNVHAAFRRVRARVQKRADGATPPA
ncbi:hypothetical protein SAMN05414137_107263 [Streptacidiphilus jiangxiensis]|uniref:Uncharacterized protein n=1 Tax=Streptacidiphilus jiangxiensis TaxID=235985 RepID=A0A1H7PA21_STRJI|nr:hypothetical protein SAMN05414137_107263 [Streptacidiphilus jiangxiensis]